MKRKIWGVFFTLQKKSDTHAHTHDYIREHSLMDPNLANHLEWSKNRLRFLNFHWAYFSSQLMNTNILSIEKSAHPTANISNVCTFGTSKVESILPSIREAACFQVKMLGLKETSVSVYPT